MKSKHLVVALAAAVAVVGCDGEQGFDTREWRLRHQAEGEGEEGEGEGEGEEGEGEGEEGEGEGEEGEGEEGEGEPPDSCAPGFVVDGSRCIPIGPVTLTRRSENAICERWRADYQFVEEWIPTPGSTDQCDLGTVPQEALDNGMARVNLYRFLAGVEPARLEPSLFAQQQACAALEHGNGQLTHQPSPETPCYSSEGAAGAGSSNIAAGAGLAGSVDLYMQDFGQFNSTTLGHRRWTIGPYMSITQFGVHGGYSCMYSFGVGGGSDPGFVAWPPPGLVPEQAAAGDFSFESFQYTPTQDTRVELAVDEGAFAPVEHRFLQGGFGHYGTAIAWAPPENLFEIWRAGRVVRVRILGTTGGDIEYTVKFVGC